MVKKEQNCVHVVIECPHAYNYNFISTFTSSVLSICFHPARLIDLLAYWIGEIRFEILMYVLRKSFANNLTLKSYEEA